MNLSSAAFFVFALFLGAFGTARAATPTFPLSVLVPGQTGHALTATASSQSERFAVEVLALQYDAGSGFPLVLVRASGQLIEDAGGVASGMSGSPVYLTRSGQDALSGAISFTFPESTGGLGLATPIATMRRADPRPDTGRTGKASAFGPTIDFSRAVPVRTPLRISGLSERASTSLGPLLASLEPSVNLGSTSLERP